MVFSQVFGITHYNTCINYHILRQYWVCRYESTAQGNSRFEAILHFLGLFVQKNRVYQYPLNPTDLQYVLFQNFFSYLHQRANICKRALKN